MPARVKVQGDLFHGVIPPGAIYVGRAAPGLSSSPYANPHKIGKWCAICSTIHETAADAVQAYTLHTLPGLVVQARDDLAGSDLACWCKPGQPCHADPLLAAVNGNAVYLIVTRGLPGSGKTSWAIGTGWPRINRDLLRDELHGVRDYTPEHEKHVTVVQRERVNTMLASGQTVVADDTNLPDRRIAEWQAIADRHGATLLVADQFLRVPVDECVRRQAGRPQRERVPADVIRRMWNSYIAEHPKAVA